MQLRSHQIIIPLKHKEIQSANSQPSNISRSNTKCNNVVRGDNNVVINHTILKSSNYRTGGESMGTTKFNDIVQKDNQMDDSATLSENKNQQDHLNISNSESCHKLNGAAAVMKIFG